MIAKIESKFFKETFFDYNCKTRFIVTSLKESPKALYEKTYCARGDMENRIKENQNSMFAKRTSCSKMRANQLRLWFSSIAYTLFHLLRTQGLKNSSMAKAQCHTIRSHLIKIGGLIKISCRRLFIQFSKNYVFKDIFLKALLVIQRTKPLLC